MVPEMLGSMYPKGDYIPLQLDDDDDDSSCGAFLRIEPLSPDRPFTISNNTRLMPVIYEDDTRRWEGCEQEDVLSNMVPGYGVDMFAGKILHRAI